MGPGVGLSQLWSLPPAKAQGEEGRAGPRTQQSAVITRTCLLKKAFNQGALEFRELVESMASMAGSMAAARRAWCWSSS